MMYCTCTTYKVHNSLYAFIKNNKVGKCTFSSIPSICPSVINMARDILWLLRLLLLNIPAGPTKDLHRVQETKQIQQTD